jgi:hypothetical protein
MHIQKTRKIQLFFLVCLLLPLVVSLFSGYQEDTDGYVLQTSRFAGLSILGIVDYPFAQYGPVWSLSLGAISILTPDVLLSAMLRIFTVVVYLFCVIRLSLHLKEIGRQSLFLIGLTTIVLTHYIAFPNHAWASTFGILFSVLVFHLITKVHLTSFKLHHIPGLSLPIVLCIFSRVQIGASLLIFVFIYLLLVRGWTVGFIFLGLTLFFTIIVLLVLHSLDLAHFAIYDQFVLAPLYNLGVQSPLLSLPIPTMSLATFLVFFIFLLERRPNLIMQLLIPLASSVVTITLILDFLNLPKAHFFRYSILQKLFTALVIAIALYISMRVIISLKRRNNSNLTPSTIFLCIIALSNCSQIYPRFGSHHAWFSFFLLLFAFLSVFPFPQQESSRSFFVGFPLPLKVLIVIMAFTQLVAIRDFSYVKKSSSFILMHPKSVAEYTNLQQQLDSSIPRGETIINLCPISSVFYLRNDLESASRFFVVWDRFLDISDYSRNIFELSPHYLVSCDDRLLMEFRKKISVSQDFALKPISRVEVLSRKWQISKIKILKST